MKRYKYQVHRNKLSDEEIKELSKIYSIDEFDPNNFDDIYEAPSVWMKCIRCGKEFDIDHEIIKMHNHGNNDGVHSLRCPVCNVKKGILYPRDLVDLDGNHITIEDLLYKK